MTINQSAINSIYLTSLIELESYVGNTPLIELTNIWKNPKVKVYAKAEWQQFGGSVKARAGYRIVRDAVESGKWLPGKRLLDATSGNTGIAYSIFAAIAGIPITIVLPENASKERKHILQKLGAEIIYSSPFESTEGAQDLAKDIAQKNPDKYVYLDQYSNPLNTQAHYEGTGVEIWNQTEGKVTHFVAGLGTTGTFVGTGKRLKKYSGRVELVALQPDSALHGLEGWKHLETARVPQIYDAQIADRHLFISTEDSYAMIKACSEQEKLFISPSAAANICGAVKVASEMEEGVIVTILADNADKYSEVTNSIFQ